VQLYSLREEVAVDFRAVLARLGAKGYAGVELAGFGDLTTAQLADALARAGLALSSAHVGYARPDDFAAALDEHQALGCDTAVVPAMRAEGFADLDAVQKTAERINRLVDVARAHGMTLGYHNHWWEMTRMADDRPALLHLFEQLAPEVVAEVDVYWAQVGGSDPADIVAALGARVALLHVKDGPADEPPSPMVAVGDGVVDVPGVLAAAPTASWHVVELDRCATDMFQAVERSYDYLVGGGYSSGRV
jgi:sugar phosphate isomerase/epimerase